MQTMTDHEAKDHFGKLLENASVGPVTITRNGEAAAVLVGAEEYASIEETLHLLSTPANAERLRQGLKDYQNGKAVSREAAEKANRLGAVCVDMKGWEALNGYESALPAR